MKPLPTAPQASRRALLMGFAAAATPIAPALANALGEPAPAMADPIFAVIAEHQAALKAYLQADAIKGGLMDHTPEWIAARAVTDSAEARELIAHKAVFTTAPTTVSGAAALLEHVAQPEYLVEYEEYYEEHPEDRQTLLSTLNECQLIEWKKRGQDFPLMLAGALRNIISRGQS
jgi:hypothetical protein